LLLIDKASNTISVYVYNNNSILQKTIGQLTWSLNIDNEIYIGRHYKSGMNIFDGNIDDIRIYNRALTESEIQQLYNE